MKNLILLSILFIGIFFAKSQGKTWPPEEDIIGNTWYDLQTWRTLQNRIYYYEDGTIGAVWNMGFDFPQFPDMGIGYNYFDGNSWGPFPFQSVTSVWAINPSYTAYLENGEMVVSQGENGLVISTREYKGTGDWIEGYFSGSGYKHPVVVTSGVDHSIIQLLYLDPDDSFVPTPAQPVRGLINYARSIDGGQTWDPAGQAPGLGPDNYLGFTIGSYIWAEPKGNVIAFVAGDYLTDLVLMKSTDGGDNWQKTIIWEHPYPFFEIFTFNSDTFYCNDGAITVALDNNNMAHVAFGLSRVYSTTSQDTIWYDPYADGIVYWREDMPGFKNTMNSLNPDSLSICGNLIGGAQDVNGNGQLDFLDTLVTYPTLGVSTMPSLIIDDLDQVILTFCSTTETYDNGIYNYKHLWARLSSNLNCDWGDFYDLTSDLIHLFDECIYPNVAPNVDDAFHLIYSIDNEPGLAVLGDHPYFENQSRYMKVNLYETKSSKESLYVDFKINQDSIFEGDTVYFQNLSCGCPYPYTFEWEFEGGSPFNSTGINPFIVYDQAGTYDVQLTASNGSSTDTELKPDYITVLPAVKVNENVIYDEVEIFPNPSTGSLTINLQNQNACNIKVFDLLGNTIYDQNYIQHNRKINLDLSGNPEGMYFLKIKSNNVNFIEKIVLKK